MKTLLLTILIVLILAVLTFGVAYADASGPNAYVFGPVECEDGTILDTIILPGQSLVGQDVDSTRVSILKSEELYDENDKLVDVYLFTPGNQPTVRCRWDASHIEEGWYFEGDILITPANP